MTAESIKNYLTAQPFQPFSIQTSSGRPYFVRHPDFAWITPRGRDLLVADEDDAVNLISVAHITELNVERSRRGKR